MEGAFAGVVIGYAKLAWYPDPYRYSHKGTEVFYPLDFRYVLRNLRSPVIFASLTCATYSGVECTIENMRDESKSSTWVNSMAGGAAAGMVLGSMSKRFDVMSTSALGSVNGKKLGRNLRLVFSSNIWCTKVVRIPLRSPKDIFSSTSNPST